MEAMRDFLNGLLMPLARVATFFQHASNFIFRNTNIFHRAIMAMAATRRDSLLDNDPEPKRRMVHLKTKEECRLGNETIQVWTVELPSKHAEGILRYACIAHVCPASMHMLTALQSH